MKDDIVNKIEFYIKKGVCLTPCNYKDGPKVGSINCQNCGSYVKNYVKDGKRIVECTFKNE